VTPAAKSLILDLLSTLRRGTMPVAALVEAGALFGLAENNVRVALARLLAAGSIERDERGRYRMGHAATPVNEHVGSWRRIDQRLRPWEPGCWLAVHTGHLDGPARARKPRARALHFLGFAELEPGLALRPANLREAPQETAAHLYDLGLEREALVGLLSNLSPASEMRASGLWDTAGLTEGYRHSRAALASSEQHLANLAPEEAMVESFLLGGRVMRQLVFDPLLPEPIVPAAERGALVAALRHYDRIGRACWASFLGRHAVPSFRAPADTRISDGATRLTLH
jgi:phenylacetic acid degradation operon negative regulatory protein